MATIIIENVPERVARNYGSKIDFSYNLSFEEDFDIDFRELSNSEITSELLKQIEETKKIPKHLLCNV
ncbi:MAG: hypothetical protein ACD_78C00065G0003 [uncultured bacterium (gcode 4)]|uniref:Uncharacterized protein n=1 Tax=uncultured bacterium (gcode 4) TaxID=1234023 RepID=K1YDS6_9BACT|nr:MAG: hypothetical protein ACD_78C00065G0003 [uncultured bacterium (gcode 4)]HBB27554.1 hypothetical protein [Candidatus Gracilibacteria bacterium]